MPLPRVIVLTDRSRREASEVEAMLLESLASHVEITAALDADAGPLPPDVEADFAIAIGGDGTLISQARRVVDRGIPLVGVNVGRLGFLAEFDPADVATHAATVFGPAPPIRELLMLSIVVRDPSGAIAGEAVAVNDCVISAGAPFRMIELSLAIDGERAPTLIGDGLIVATPVGSTAYNVSAGGPIVNPGLDAIVMTPLAAHSLAFRSIVLRDDARLRIDLRRTNPGTALVRDGEVMARLEVGATVEIRKHHRKASFVINPGTTYWRIVQDKLRWAAPPNYRAP